MGESPPRARPPRTSGHSFEQHLAGRLLVAGTGAAWRHLPAQLYRRPDVQEPFVVPAVAEPQIVWIVRGRAAVFERDLLEREWRGGEVEAGAFFLTDSDGPYELRWEVLGADPFEVLMVHVDLSLLRLAWAERESGSRTATPARTTHRGLRDVSRGHDPQLSALLGAVRAELTTSPPSALLIDALAQSLAVHLVRHYAAPVTEAPRGAPTRRLTAFKLRRIVERMAQRLDRELDLRALARHVDLSPSHLSRVFRQTTGETPSHHFLRLRMTAACRLLRETDRSVIEIALSVGYATHSHFTQVFRRHVGQTPSEYRAPR